MTERRERVVVGMSGTDGLPYGIALLELLRALAFEVHLVMSSRAEAALAGTATDVRALAGQVHPHGNQAARISSGSFLTRGMIVVPCSAHAAAAIGLGLARNLVQRAADVTLKEQRPLVLAVPGSSFRRLDVELLARLTSVPGLEVLPLEGVPGEAAVRLLAGLRIECELAPA